MVAGFDSTGLGDLTLLRRRATKRSKLNDENRKQDEIKEKQITIYHLQNDLPPIKKPNLMME